MYLYTNGTKFALFGLRENRRPRSVEIVTQMMTSPDVPKVHLLRIKYVPGPVTYNVLWTYPSHGKEQIGYFDLQENPHLGG